MVSRELGGVESGVRARRSGLGTVEGAQEQGVGGSINWVETQSRGGDVSCVEEVKGGSIPGPGLDPPTPESR